MAVARQAAATASPARPARPTVSWPDLLCFAKACWIALPGGVALTLLAFILRSTLPDKAAPADTPAAVEPIQSPANTRAVIPAPPANIPAPRVEHTDTQFDQVQMPSAPATPGTERRPAKKAAHYTSAQTVRKTHTLGGRSSPFVIHGVLTPPDDPMVRHDGGH